jgi:hypothetical protein
MRPAFYSLDECIIRFKSFPAISDKYSLIADITPNDDTHSGYDARNGVTAVARRERGRGVAQRTLPGGLRRLPGENAVAHRDGALPIPP